MNDGTVVVPTEAPKPTTPPPVRNENGTYTQAVKFVLPATLEKRKEIAKTNGFADDKGEATISEVRPALKDPKRAEAAKNYIKQVKEASETLDGTVVYPAADASKMDDLQELIAWLAKCDSRAALLTQRRKGEELVLTYEYAHVFDLMGEDEDDAVEYDDMKDSVLAALEVFVKECGFNQTTSIIVNTAIAGIKSNMLRVGRKFFKSMENAQSKFSEWCATKADLDFDSIQLWMKRQAKRLASANAAKEINETEVQI